MVKIDCSPSAIESKRHEPVDVVDRNFVAVTAPVDAPVRRRFERGISGRHICAARALLNWSMHDLAIASGVSLSSIRRLEDGRKSPSVRTRWTTITALQEAGVGFMLADVDTVAVYRK
ncbi:helix-turn-helix domain-containing protein [uncultured Methylobacterium sp.]|jgi:DNA-binding transcriptional regulator YiaG|uniref:helix-turn-helix domain-containing protein n=1 Tax=uncultured Methylobacterium sp. TaxID=157278 RepID=UPI00261D5952|nr:helix-turn-helix domain-containing protein [uncultured Methylobacterium sp.]